MPLTGNALGINQLLEGAIDIIDITPELYDVEIPFELMKKDLLRSIIMVSEVLLNRVVVSVPSLEMLYATTILASLGIGFALVGCSFVVLTD